MMSPGDVGYRFGDFILDPGEQRLLCGGHEVHLRPKSFAVLALLVARHARLVDRQTFFDVVWRDVQVTDDALSRCIREIRQALGDEARAPRFVRTVSKRGYVFIHPVSRSGPEHGAGPAGLADGTPDPETIELPARRPGLAVLPFADMSPERDQAYFCEGIAEDILTELSRLEGLRVIARTSAFAFRNRPVDVRTIGRTLDVDTVLEGSVRRDGDRVRVTAQLVSTTDGGHLWADRYDRDITDVFALQAEIALTIADALRVHLADDRRRAMVRRQPVDQEAHRLFLMGRFYLNRRHPGDHERAVAHFEQALARDDHFAAPAAAIADAFVVLGVWGFLPPQAAFTRARASADRALALDDTMAEAHLTLALVAWLHRRNRSAARTCFRSAFDGGLRTSLAHAWYASSLIDEGHETAALAQAHQALLMDPLSPMVHTAAAAVSLSLGRQDEARGLVRRALDLDEASPVAHHLLGWCEAAAGRDESAIASLRQAADAGLVASTALLGVLHARSHRRDHATAVLEEFDQLSRTRWVPDFERALVHAAIDDTARSLALVDSGLARGEPIGLSTLGRFLSGLLPDEWIHQVKARAAVPMDA